MTRRIPQDLVVRALDRAVTHSRPPAGVLHHLDRGSQYAAAAYQERLKKYGMTVSMSRKGNCYDNAMIESWHILLKKELIYLTKFAVGQKLNQRSFLTRFSIIGSESIVPWILRPQLRLRRHIKCDSVNVSILGVILLT
ncbi:DDE-type integrase/transposase/recombinase [Sulfobacillus thermosulfidooxidans]|uniref:DDE-type integrase/transposase/recombinase n=1 Tax=Sulfobacillus thermosulfidooxidans TaxID=28034 RepID=UPI0002D721FC|nr:DDE-type integrase/transposase/recombinase [Sulfobacillus thermosulfidooxidans]